MRGAASLLGVLALAACHRTAEAPPPPAVPIDEQIEEHAVEPERFPVIPSVTLRPDRPAELTHVTIKAIGMDCPESCPLRVREALAAVPNVYELGFDLDHEAIYMSYDSKLGPPKQATKPMIAAIRQAGFDPWLAKESWPDDAVVAVVAP